MIKRIDWKLPPIDGEQQITPPEVLAEYRRRMLHSRESLELHTRFEIEREMYLYIQNGDPEGLMAWLRAQTADSLAAGAMSENDLTQSRCIFMVGMALYTRYAIQGGLDQEMAYNLSDAYVHVADAMTDPAAVLQMLLLAALDFAQRVKAARTSGPPAVKLCLSYISDHLYYKITLAELAGACSLSPNYLSTLFREQMGIGLRDYILNEKLDAAGRLLLTTDLPVAQVAARFSFCSPSNFTARFKRRFGVTPQVYRAGGGEAAAGKTSF